MSPRDGRSPSLPKWYVDDLVAIAIVALVFGQAIAFGFVDWDDPNYILRNPLVHDPLSGGIGELFLTPTMGYPQPVTVLTQHLDLVIGGGAGWTFHLTNLVLHAVSTLLVRRVLAGYDLSRGAALAGGILFAVHPLVAEPVCWAVGRKDLLAVLFVLAGFVAYRALWRARGKGAAALAAGWTLAQVLAVGSKTLGAVLPLLVAADLILFRRRPTRAVAVGLAMTGAIAMAAAALPYLAPDRTLVAARPIDERVAYVSQHLALQLRNLFAPAELLPKYLEDLPRPLGSGWGLAGVIAVVGMAAALAVAIARRARRQLLAVIWFAIGFVPASGIVDLGHRGPADVYLYLPLAGVALSFGALLDHLRPHAGRLAVWSIPVAVLASLAFAAFVQGGIWRSPSDLWKSVRDAYPRDQRAWWAYADGLSAEGRVREAVAVYEDGLPRFPYPPNDPRVLTSMGRGCALAGDAACATRWYGEAMRHFPGDPGRALQFLGAASALANPAYEKEMAAADREVARALTELPRSAEALSAFFTKVLARDRISRRALLRYSAHETAGRAARALLLLYRRRDAASR